MNLQKLCQKIGKTEASFKEIQSAFIELSIEDSDELKKKWHYEITCSACPFQVDFYLKDSEGKPIYGETVEVLSDDGSSTGIKRKTGIKGYLRERHGMLRIYCPDYDGECVLEIPAEEPLLFDENIKLEQFFISIGLQTIEDFYFN